MKIYRTALINKNGQVFGYSYFTQKHHAESIAKKQKNLMGNQDWHKLITAHELELSKDGIISLLIQLASHGNQNDVRL